MLRCLVLLAGLVAGGCGRLGFEASDGGPLSSEDSGVDPIDAAVDAADGEGSRALEPVDGAVSYPCQEWPFIPTDFDPCDLAPPMWSLALEDAGTWVLDADAGTLVDPEGRVDGTLVSTHIDGLRVVAVGHVEVGADATLRLIATGPAALAAWGDITVEGVIDASSSVGAPGPGAGQGACGGDPGYPGALQADAGSGGGGGGFGGGGGTGQETLAGPGGNGGAAVAMPGRVSAGCSGGIGGGGGVGGPGGGGLVLASAGDLLVSGVVDAGGAGGERGLEGTVGEGGGGGGGGSGGMLVLEGTSISATATAALVANGGGGADWGEPGLDGRRDEQRAGNGGSRDGEDGLSVVGTASDGGRGGGGGVGFIVARGASVSLGPALTSPTAVVE